MDNTRVELDQGVIQAAFARWGIFGTFGRIWKTWRTGGSAAVRYKFRTFYVQFIAPGRKAGLVIPPPPMGPAPEPVAAAAQILEPTLPLASTPELTTSPTPQPVPTPVAHGNLVLGDDRATDPVSWDRWLSTLLTKRLIEPSRKSRAKALTGRLWIAVDQRGAAADIVRLRWTLDAVAELENKFSGEVAVAIIDTGAGQDDAIAKPVEVRAKKELYVRSASIAHCEPLTLEALLDRVADEDLVLFTRIGDRVRPELALALSVYDLFDADIATVDLYFDDQNRIHPLLLPGANPLMGMNCDHFRSRFMAQGRAIREAFATVCENVNKAPTPYDLAATVFEDGWLGNGRRCVHLPVPLIHINETRARLHEDMHRHVRSATDIVLGGRRASALGARPSGDVSIVICTKDKGHLLRQLVRHALQTKGECIRDIVIVSNQTGNAFATSTLEHLSLDRRVEIIDYPEPFNFSRQCNLGARFAKGSHLLFLNDDIAPVSDAWLEQLLAPLAHPEVGAVGPLLVYPDERVQHAGMFLGYASVAGHAMRFARVPDDDYNFLCTAPREAQVLTGAAMMMTRVLFEDLNGFDPLLATYIQDVDLCLRIRGTGKRLVYNPRSILVHMESASIAEKLSDHGFNEKRGVEHSHFMRRWGTSLDKDPFHNPNFCRQNEALRVLRTAD